MSTLTKKHYEAIADCIEYRLCAKDNHPHEIAKRLADYFAQDNPRFDRTRFLQACGVEQSTAPEKCHTCKSPYFTPHGKCRGCNRQY